MTDATKADMAAFGASEAACYHWPGDSVDDRLCRAAFCAGAAWAAGEIERLLNAIKRIDGINDNPADFNVAIDEVCSAILRPR